jgi:hypothetical protein
MIFVSKLTSTEGEREDWVRQGNLPCQSLS